MATVTLKGHPIETVGDLPTLGSQAPNFTLVSSDLSDISLSTFLGRQVVLNIFPSIDTPTCASSVRKFNEIVANQPDTVVLCISSDLPFAQARFCGAEGLDNVKTLSTFRAPEFGQAYGVTFLTGPLTGLNARAVIILDKQGQVKYTQLVSEVADQPDYEAALTAL